MIIIYYYNFIINLEVIETTKLYLITNANHENLYGTLKKEIIIASFIFLFLNFQLYLSIQFFKCVKAIKLFEESNFMAYQISNYNYLS